jgi:hypothetical protein
MKALSGIPSHKVAFMSTSVPVWRALASLSRIAIGAVHVGNMTFVMEPMMLRMMGMYLPYLISLLLFYVFPSDLWPAISQGSNQPPCKPENQSQPKKVWTRNLALSFCQASFIGT